MSHNYQSTTYNPPISPEERQKREMNAAIDRAITVANNQHREEINRLNNQHAAETASLNQKLSAMNSQYSGMIRQHQQKMDQMRQNFDAQLQLSIAEQTARRQRDLRQQRQYFDSQLERQESQHRQEMARQQQVFNDALQHEAAQREQLRYDLEIQLDTAVDDLNANIDNLRSDTQFAINQVNQNIQLLAEETQQSLDDIRADINSIFDAMTEAAERKRELQQAYNEQLSIIQMKNYQKYAPDQLQRIEAQLNGIDVLPDTAACAVLHTAFNNLIILDSDIEQARIEYEAKHLITLKTIEEILVTMNSNRNTPVTFNNEVELDDRGEVVKIELDFWTDGKYSELEKELMGIKESVQNGIDDPKFTTNDLDKALDRAVQINQEQNQLVIDAIERGNASQIRAEMADCVADILRGQRFSIIQRGYENNDARNAYIVKLDDGTSKIVVIINPVSNKKNKVVISTVVTDLSESDLEEQGQEINEILAEEMGIDTLGSSCDRNNPAMDEAMRNIFYDLNITQNPIPDVTRKAANL